jgi:hypothetical protein
MKSIISIGMEGEEPETKAKRYISTDIQIQMDV